MVQGSLMGAIAFRWWQGKAPRVDNFSQSISDRLEKREPRRKRHKTQKFSAWSAVHRGRRPIQKEGILKSCNLASKQGSDALFANQERTVLYSLFRMNLKENAFASLIAISQSYVSCPGRNREQPALKMVIYFLQCVRCPRSLCPIDLSLCCRCEAQHQFPGRICGKESVDRDKSNRAGLGPGHFAMNFIEAPSHTKSTASSGRTRSAIQRSGNVFGCLSNQQKKQTFRYPESEGDFSLHYHITFMLSEEPFLSVRQTAKNAMMSKSIVYHPLTQTMKWKLQHLQRVPHSPTESEKTNRVQRAAKPLELLESIRHEMWQYIITLDDLWF
jgi:hypothetical protein